MRVLLVEPDKVMAQTIDIMLKSEGFNVYTTDLGDEALDLGRLYDYDIILMELDLPDVSGFSVLSSLRRGKVHAPVMIVSSDKGADNIVRCLNAGADEYVTKPFNRDEVIARINAIIRRSKGYSNSLIETAGYCVDINRKRVTVDGVQVHLTGKEYGLIELLSLRKGAVLTKDVIMNHLYGGIDEPDFKVIDAFVCRIRQKLGRAVGGPHGIDTVWGVGYVLNDPEPATA